VASAVARSPIQPTEPVVVRDGWEVSARRSDAGLTLTDVTATAKLQVKADANGAFAAGALPYGRAVRTGAGRLEVGTGPGEWHHLLPLAQGADLLAELTPRAAAAGELVTVLDVTHGRAAMRLTGDHAADLLAKVCAVNLSERATPDLAAFRSSVAKTVTDVVRDDVQGRRSYLLVCDRSVGQYLFDCLLDAGREFGIDEAGAAQE
jgi:heterotetrameric sarcosine oxidase gamma subunit